MTDIHYFQYLNSSKRLEAARFVSSYAGSAHSKEQTLAPISFHEVLESDLALVALVDGVLAGYIRAKRLLCKEGTSYRQVGSLLVAQASRSLGVGSELVSRITEEVVAGGSMPYAFCGLSSKYLFAKAGYIQAPRDELPAEAVSLYGNQPMVYSAHTFVQMTEGII
jgi:predicted N-acetyltransferase YhbS